MHLNHPGNHPPSFQLVENLSSRKLVLVPKRLETPALGDLPAGVEGILPAFASCPTAASVPLIVLCSENSWLNVRRDY